MYATECNVVLNPLSHRWENQPFPFCQPQQLGHGSFEQLANGREDDGEKALAELEQLLVHGEQGQRG
jgi:hypothetical protein